MSANRSQDSTAWNVTVMSGLNESSVQEEGFCGSDGLTLAEVFPAEGMHDSTQSILVSLGSDSGQTIDSVSHEGVEKGDGGKGSFKGVQTGNGGKGSSKGVQHSDGGRASSMGVQNNDGGKASSKGVQTGNGGKGSSKEVQHSDGGKASSKGVEPGDVGKGSSEGVQHTDGGKGSSEGVQHNDGGKGSSTGVQSNDGGKASSKGVQHTDGGKGSTEGVQHNDGGEASSKGVQHNGGGEASSNEVQHNDGDKASSEEVQHTDSGEASSEGVQKGDGGKGSSKGVQKGDGGKGSSKEVQKSDGGKGSSNGFQNTDGDVQSGNDMVGVVAGDARLRAPADEQGMDVTLEARVAQASDLGRELIEQAMKSKDGILGVHSSLEAMLQEQFSTALRAGPMPDVSESETEPGEVEVNEAEPRDAVLEQCKENGWKVSTECAVGRRYKRMLQKNHALWTEYSACTRREKLEKIKQWVQQKWDSYAEPSGIKRVEHVKHCRV
jgi:hypothetical protein